MKIKEEVVNIADLAESANTIDMVKLSQEIIQKEFLAGAMQDNVGVLYVKPELVNPELTANLLAQVDSWVGKKTELQSMYEHAASVTKQEARFKLDELSDDDIKAMIGQILSNVQVRPAPQDMDESYKLFSYNEISSMAKNSMIMAFQQKTNLAEFLYKQGVSSDYRPSPDVVELAILTAYFVKALEGDQTPKLVLPTGKLFTP